MKNESWTKSSSQLYSLIFLLGFDSKSALVRPITHNHWSIKQQKLREQKSVKSQKLFCFNFYSEYWFGMEQNWKKYIHQLTNWALDQIYLFPILPDFFYCLIINYFRFKWELTITEV